jgi:homoserine kinase type II
VREISREFRAGKVRSFEPMEGGSANSSYTVCTDKGKYVLSVCDEKSSGEIQNLVELLCYLDNNYYPTTKIVKAANGDYVIRHRDKPIILKEFIEGEVCKHLNPNMLIQTGEAIARLHKIPPPSYLSKTFPYGTESFSDVTSGNLNSKYIEWLKEKKKYICAHLSPHLPKGLVHGDIFYDNMLFRNQKLAAIIDFEEASDYYKIFDLGMCIVGTCTENRAVSLEKAKYLVEGYQSEKKMEKIERESLQVFTEYGAVATSFWRFRQFNMRNHDSDKAGSYQEMVNIADKINAVPEREFIKSLFGSS